MEVIFQIHSRPLCPRKGSRYPLSRRLQQFWTFWWREISLAPVGVRAAALAVRSRVAVPTVLSCAFIDYRRQAFTSRVSIIIVGITLFAAVALQYINFTTIAIVLIDCRRT